MCPPQPKVTTVAATPAAAPAAQGADSLRIGNEDAATRARGGVGRLKLSTRKTA